MNPFACPHIEDLASLRRRAEAARRLRSEALAKVRQGRWEELTPEERGWVVSELSAACPDA
ncbi:hypothetical protein WMF30_10260 [Sorangium sp. So ce134]